MTASTALIDEARQLLERILELIRVPTEELAASHADEELEKIADRLDELYDLGVDADALLPLPSLDKMTPQQIQSEVQRGFRGEP